MKAGTGGVLVQTRINRDTAKWVEKRATLQAMSVAQWLRSLIVDARRADPREVDTDLTAPPHATLERRIAHAEGAIVAIAQLGGFDLDEIARRAKLGRGP